MLMALAPRLPRSCGVPSLSHITACGPRASGGSTELAHVPVAPAASLLSLIQSAMPILSPGSGLSWRISPSFGPHTTASYARTCGPVGENRTFEGQSGSIVAVSAAPMISPLLLMFPTAALLPPSVGRAVIAPRCHWYAMHLSPVPNEQKFSLNGSLAAASPLMAA